jgi:hypothetical protein
LNYLTAYTLCEIFHNHCSTLVQVSFNEVIPDGAESPRSEGVRP